MASKQTARRTPSSPWDMRWPHCVGRMCWEFSLVSGPSLQALRDWLPSVVRTLHRYYTRVRLLARVPVGLPALAFSHRSAAQLRRRCRPGLPVLVHDVSGRARGLLDCAGSRGDFVLAPPFVWSSPFVIGSTPWNFSFTAQYPARPCPC